MIQVALVVLTRANLLIDFIADFSVSLGLLFDQLKDVQLLETLSRLELINDLAAFLVWIAIATRSNKKDGRFDSRAELSKCLLEVLFRANLPHIRSCLQVWHQALCILVELSNALG